MAEITRPKDSAVRLKLVSGLEHWWPQWIFRSSSSSSASDKPDPIACHPLYHLTAYHSMLHDQSYNGVVPFDSVSRFAVRTKER